MLFSEILSNRKNFTPLHPYFYVNDTKNNVTHLFLSNLQLNCRGWEILNGAFSCIPGMYKHAFPFLRGISHTSASSQPLEVCLCRGGGIVRTTQCRPLTRLVISIKVGSRSFVSIFSSCFFSTVQTLVRWTLSNPVAVPHPVPMTCKSVPLISLWRDGEWSGEASCPLPPSSPPLLLHPSPPLSPALTLRMGRSSEWMDWVRV